MDKYMDLGWQGIIPVVVLDDAEKAVPTAHALYRGGLSSMEITLRTAAAIPSIRKVAEDCPEMQVGAGSVRTLEQCRASVEAGAKFIVSPGFPCEIVRWCLEHDVPIIPGCVTPTEVSEALSLGLKYLKFFPAEAFGGLAAMKALAGPFGGIQFVPTGGIGADNFREYLKAPFVRAVGGSWLCTRADIESENYDRIEKLSREALEGALGFEISHIGINMPTEAAAAALAQKWCQLFGFSRRAGRSSIFAGTGIEVMKTPGPGALGHIAVGTNDINRAVQYLTQKGITLDWSTAKKNRDKLIAVYLAEPWAGFAVHLMQK